MRSLISVAALAFALAACSPPAAEAPTAAAPAPVEIAAPSGVYQIDKSHASVTVRALHFGLSHYTLELTELDGTLTFDAANPAASAITASVNTGSVRTDYVGDRDFDAELENSEWLDALQFPQATFQSTGVEITGANTARVTGDLTIKGQTHPAVFDVTYNGGAAAHPAGFDPNARVGLSARAVIKRSAYGVSALLATADNPAAGVSDDVEILIEAEFIRQADAAPSAPAE